MFNQWKSESSDEYIPRGILQIVVQYKMSKQLKKIFLLIPRNWWRYTNMLQFLHPSKDVAKGTAGECKR